VRKPVLPIAFLCVLGLAAQDPGWELTLTAPGPGERAVRARAKAPAGTEWVALFLRKEGEAEFETVRLDPGPDGTYTIGFEAAQAVAMRIQWYGAMRGPGGVRTLPADAPATFHSLLLPAGPPPPPHPPAPKPHGPVYVDGNATERAHRKLEQPGEPEFAAAGQVRYVFQKDDADRHFGLATRLVYSNQPAPRQAPWSVGEIQVAYAAGDHRVQAGDLNTQESDFTLGAGGRRGLDYTWSGRPMGAHLFALSTERQAGFTALAWPVAGSAAYGGSLTRLWLGNTVRTKVVLLTGQDDPASAANVATAYAAPVREGTTAALLVDGRFLGNRLGLGGEYARSLFTLDARTGAAKVDDQAWRLGGQWAEGPVNAQVGYRDVGRDFGTVGVAFFVGDRRVLDGSVGVNGAKGGLTLSATDERTNPNGQANVIQAWNQTQSLDARVVLSPRAAWRVGLRAARQEAEVVANPLIPFSNSERAGISTGLEFNLPPRAVLTCNAQYDRLRATGAVASTGTSATLSAGGNFTFPGLGRVSPNLSWARVLSQPGAQLTLVSNAFLNAEFLLIPGALGVLLNGGASRTALASGAAFTATTAEGTLNWTVDRYLQGLARGVAGMKVRYTHNPLLPGAADDNRVFLLLNVAY